MRIRVEERAYPNRAYLENTSVRGLQKRLIRLLVRRRYGVIISEEDSASLSFFRNARATLQLFDETFARLDRLLAGDMNNRLRMFARRMRCLELLTGESARNLNSSLPGEIIHLDEEVLRHIFSTEVAARHTAELHNVALAQTLNFLRSRFEFASESLKYEALLALEHITISHRRRVLAHYERALSERGQGSTRSRLETELYMCLQRLTNNKTLFVRRFVS